MNMQNQRRASWAESALDRFIEVADSRGDVETDVGDLICNLCHLLERRKFGEEAILKIVSNGVAHWHVERRSEDEDDEFDHSSNVEVIVEDVDYLLTLTIQEGCQTSSRDSST
jgi:hypothetical protein